MNVYGLLTLIGIVLVLFMGGFALGAWGAIHYDKAPGLETYREGKKDGYDQAMDDKNQTDALRSMVGHAGSLTLWLPVGATAIPLSFVGGVLIGRRVEARRP